MANTNRSPAIDNDRLRALFDDVTAFGRSPETGEVNRIAFSDADMEARRWLALQMEETGLSVRWDSAGNVIGRWGDADAPAVMAGSHLDSAPRGGAFDGALGVCIALESVRAMREAGIEPTVPVEVIATSGGGQRFGRAVGAAALAGQLDPTWIEGAADADGVSLADAMAAQGLDASTLADAARPAGALRAFLELHAEQGPALEANGQSVGIVDAASGACQWQVTLTGVTHHSGTTPMEMRSDAFAGLAEIAATIPSIIRIVGSAHSRVTIGQVELSPNKAHLVPGKAVFSLVIRDTSEKVMKTLAASFRALIDRVAKSRFLSVTVEETDRSAPVALDTGLARTAEDEAKRLDLAYMRMISGAGHDAETMQAICPAALIFVPSRDGAGQSAEEWTDWTNVEQGAALYLAVLSRLCQATASERPAEPVVLLPPIPMEAEAGEIASDVEADTGAEPAEVDLDAEVEADVEADSDEPHEESAERDPASTPQSEDSPKKATQAEDDDDDLDFDFELDEIALREED